MKRHFFQNWDVGALNFFLSVKNGSPEVGGRVYGGFPNPDLCTSDHQTILFMILDVLRQFLFRNWGEGGLIYPPRNFQSTIFDQ